MNSIMNPGIHHEYFIIIVVIHHEIHHEFAKFIMNPKQIHEEILKREPLEPHFQRK